MTTLDIRTRAVVEAVDVTPLIEAEVAKRGIQDGAVLVYSPHTTAGVFVNEGADPDVWLDVSAVLDRLVPRAGPYAHTEGNSAAHIKTILVGSSQLLPISSGRLALGTWQHVFFAEFDGPRSRRLMLKFLRG